MVAICPTTAQGNWAFVSDLSKWLFAPLPLSGNMITTSRNRSAPTCLQGLKTAKQMHRVIKERQTLGRGKKYTGLFA